jgi:hypothetical protein
MVAYVYDQGLLDLTSGAPSGGAPWLSNAYKITLVTSAYTFAYGDRYASAFSGMELSTLSFTAGYGGLMRKAITGKTVSYNVTSHHVEFAGDALTWSGLSAGSAGWAIMVRESGTDALSPVLVAYQLVNVVTNGGDLVLTPPASGYVVVSAG